MDYPPGTMVEYHSASMNQWIPARVLRAGRTHGTVDLDCKEGVDVSRVRPAQSSAPPTTAPQIAPTCPKLGGVVPATSLGPLGLKAGDCCFYKSGTHGWISATVVRYRPDENNYDLDVKQQVGLDKIQTIQDGMLVEYLSASTNQWIPARVVHKGQSAGNYDLDCKTGVHISRLRIPSGSSGSTAPVIPDTMPQGLSGGGGGYSSANSTMMGGMRGQGGILKQSPYGGGADPKLQQLRHAVQAEDATELRKRMESKSALNYVGEELDHAQHALWVLEARPEALKDLKRACSRNSIDELQAALEAAAVVGVDDNELETASRRLFALQGRMWRYDGPGDGRHMDLRKEPRTDAPRVRQRLNLGDVFEVAEERQGTDGVLYLRLADGRGWAFDHKPGVGTMCVKQYAEEESRRAQMGHQPISLTIADLRSQHSKAMKPARAAQLLAIAEEDTAGPYVILERTAVTPALALCNESDIVTTLDAGTVVDVLEVAQRPELKRIRGRLSHPRGWISIVDTKSGKRWAEKQSY